MVLLNECAELLKSVLEKVKHKIFVKKHAKNLLFMAAGSYQVDREEKKVDVETHSSFWVSKEVAILKVSSLFLHFFETHLKKQNRCTRQETTTRQNQQPRRHML